MVASILDSVDKNKLDEFTKDFIEMIRVAVGMHKVYSKSAQKLAGSINKYNGLIESFNKKYKHIEVHISKSIDELNTMIYINSKDVKELFMNVASKIPGLRSIGTKGFEEAKMEDSDRFSKKMSSIKDEVYLSYYYPERGSDNIYLKMEQEKVLILFNPDIIIDELSAEFKLCAYYGAKEVDFEIDVYNEAASFGFVDAPSDSETSKFKNKYDPTILE
jgi:hypothetical protein